MADNFYSLFMLVSECIWCDGRGGWTWMQDYPNEENQ